MLLESSLAPFHTASFPGAIDGNYALLDNWTTPEESLSLIAEKAVYHKDALLQEEKRPDLYKVSEKACAKVPPGSNGLLHSSSIFGEPSPVDDHFMRGGIRNVSRPYKREDIARAALEGAAFDANWPLEGVSRSLNRRCDTLRIFRGRRGLGCLVSDPCRHSRPEASSGLRSDRTPEAPP